MHRWDNHKYSIPYSHILLIWIIGLLIFFYNTPQTIAPYNQPPNTHQISSWNNTSSQLEINLQHLLTILLREGIIPHRLPSYQALYNQACLQHPLQCKHITNKLSPDHPAYHYRSLLSLATRWTLTHPFSQDTTTTIIIKNDSTQKRGYATHSSIIINSHGLQPQEFFEVLTHELGHRIDFWLITGSSWDLDTTFTEFGDPQFAIDDPSLLYYRLSRLDEKNHKQDSTIYDFCSDYGRTNPFEDLAECFNLYINHHDYFVALTKHNHILAQKYDWFISHIPTPPFRQWTLYSLPTTKRVWDSTKISL